MHHRKQLVSFFGIGAPKSGTSWLARCLDEHPELSIPVKETHFFSRDAEYERGIPHFEAKLVDADASAKHVGEFSPNYLSHAASYARVHEYAADALLLVALRNPIDRAFSHYLHEVRAGQATLEEGFANAAKRRHEYLHHGFYGQHLAKWLEHFDARQIHTEFYENIRSEASAVLGRAYRFLDVDADFLPPSLQAQVNRTRVPRNQVIERVFDGARATLGHPMLRRPRRLLKDLGVARWVRAVNTQASQQPTLDAAEREWLRGVFSSDVARLESILGRRVPWSDFHPSSPS